MRAKVIVLAGVMGFLSLTLPVSLMADTVYTYTGTGPDPISVTFDTTWTGTQLDNIAPGTDITSDVVSASLTDAYLPPGTDQGGFTVGVNNFVPPLTIEIGTDASGDITSWDITENFFASYPAVPNEDPNDFYCVFQASTSGSGDQTTLAQDHDAGLCPTGTGVQQAGTWTSVDPPPQAPEPQSYLLFGSGLVVLLTLSRRPQSAVTK